MTSIVSTATPPRGDTAVLLLPGGQPLELTPTVLGLAAIAGCGTLFLLFLLCLICKKIAFSKPRPVGSSIHNTTVYATPNGKNSILYLMITLEFIQHVNKIFHRPSSSNNYIENCIYFSRREPGWRVHHGGHRLDEVTFKLNLSPNGSKTKSKTRETRISSE